MNMERPDRDGQPARPLVDDDDINEAFDTLTAAMESNTKHSLRDFRPDDHIRPYEESTPDERAAREDFESLHQALVEAGVSIRERKVLEIGSGMGELLRVLRAEGVDAVGVDFNPREFSSPHDPVGIINAPLEALKPSKIGTFGLIVCKNLFDDDRYGFQVYGDMLRSIDLLLEPGGVFVKVGTGDFRAEDIPAGWEILRESPGYRLSLYRKR